MGEALRFRGFARLPDGNRLLFRPFTWDHEGIKEIYGSGEYEKLFRIHEGDVVIDVGAHIGIFAVKAARLVGGKGVVVAIEPDRENYSFLMANKKINNLKNVIPVCGALSDYRGKARLYSWKCMVGGYSIVEKHSSHYVEVPVFTLDHLATQLGLVEVDFVKIDAEGAELEVLQGSKRTLRRSSARVVIAGYHAPDDPKAISYFIESLGYKALVSGSNFIYACK
jgi:FkbM family methyltransferase